MAEINNEEKGFAKISLKMSIFLLIACPLIVIILCSVTIKITAKKMVPDNLYSFDEPTVFAIEAPDSDKNAVLLADSLAINAETTRLIRVTGEKRFEINGLEGSLSGEQADFAAFTAQKIGGGISDKLFSQSFIGCEYGEVSPVLFDREMLEGAVSVSGDERKLPEINPENGELKYTLALSEKASDALFAQEEQAVISEIKTAFAEYFTVEAVALTPDGENASTADFAADGVSGQLREIKFTKRVKLSLRVNFIGALAELGSQELVLKCKFTQKTWLTFAGIKVNNKEIIIHKNGYNTLSLSINADENGEAKLSFTSSEPSVCTVDEKGMVEAVKESTSPVTITAKLEYYGKVFTDTCTVWVITKTTGVEIGKAEHTMKKDEVVTLTAKVQPKNATIKDIIWLSSDESVCTVNENGEVHAISAGEALVTAVTAQGHFMEACKITVEG